MFALRFVTCQVLFPYIVGSQDQEALTSSLPVSEDLVEAVMKSTHRQKVDYDGHSTERPFKLGDLQQANRIHDVREVDSQKSKINGHS